MLTLDHKNTMWENGILGESNPTQLRKTVLLLIGIHIGLHAGESITICVGTLMPFLHNCHLNITTKE